MRVRIAHMIHGCRTLGPGRRTVIWVRGCARRCPGCVATPILGEGPSLDLTPEQLAEVILASGDEGVTFSGGEPFEQALALAHLARLLRAQGLSVLTYSGFTLEELRSDPTPGALALLTMTDILIDGPFDVSCQANRLWRGSDNQRLHLLSARHPELAASIDGPGVGVELRFDPEGRLFWAGVPPVAFQTQLQQGARVHGIEILGQQGVWA